jgi:hypothetical protein
MNLEQLGRDPHGNISSQPPIKSGKNRGFRGVEVGGLTTSLSFSCF